MASGGERSTHFPAIEKKHGKPMSRWFGQLADLGDAIQKHLTIGPWGDDPMTAFAADPADYETNKKSFKVPLDWKVDATRLNQLVRHRLNEIT